MLLGLALLVGLGGCAGAADETAEPVVPVAEAESLPFEDSVLSPPAPPPGDEDAVATDGALVEDAEPVAPSPVPSPSPAIGPTSADAAAFVAGDALQDLAGLEHVVVDLDGDTWSEVVATGILDRRGVVRVAWWTADGYVVLAEAVAGPGRGITDLRAADVNDDGHTELLVFVDGEGLASLAVWAVPRRGVIEPLDAVGGCHDGGNVYGVTRARLVAQGDAPPAIAADCDDSPLPVADWSEQRWVWDAGAYRAVKEDLPVPAGDGPGAGEGAGDDGDRSAGEGDEPGQEDGEGDGDD